MKAQGVKEKHLSASPQVRGWCPGTWRPMATGDGLLVRVRPPLGRLARAQMLSLCQAAETWGSGLIELTRRANLQLRGVTEAGWPELMAFLVEHGLAAPDAEGERPPALLLAPEWREGDATHEAARLLERRMTAWPVLPDKWGLALDAGPAPVLSDVPADLRLERSRDGGLLVRADGRKRGTPVADLESTVELMTRLAYWFVDQGGLAAGRMRRFTAPLPGWAEADTEPAAASQASDVASGLAPGPHPHGRVVGLPFGRVSASVLRDALGDGVTGVRVTPWRRLLVEGENETQNTGDGLIHDVCDPRLAMDACPGAPFCAQASVATLRLATSLANALAERRSTGPGKSAAGRLHISGCAKGCARSGPAEVCLTGRDGRYDLILGGRADDAPVATGLGEADAVERIAAVWKNR